MLVCARLKIRQKEKVSNLKRLDCNCFTFFIAGLPYCGVTLLGCYDNIGWSHPVILILKKKGIQCPFLCLAVLVVKFIFVRGPNA